MASFRRIFDEYCTLKGLHSFEGDSGLEKLEVLLKDMGYKGHGFRFGTPIESFLSDNPGAVIALLDWVIEEAADENWKDSLESCLPAEDTSPHTVELSNGGALEFEDDGVIRYIDCDGNTENIWRPGDEDYDTYKEYLEDEDENIHPSLKWKWGGG